MIGKKIIIKSDNSNFKTSILKIFHTNQLLKKSKFLSENIQKANGKNIFSKLILDHILQIQKENETGWSNKGKIKKKRKNKDKDKDKEIKNENEDKIVPEGISDQAKHSVENTNIINHLLSGLSVNSEDLYSQFRTNQKEDQKAGIAEVGCKKPVKDHFHTKKDISNLYGKKISNESTQANSSNLIPSEANLEDLVKINSNSATLNKDGSTRSNLYSDKLTLQKTPYSKYKSNKKKHTYVWTPYEDHVLLTLTNSKFAKKWRVISEVIGTKSPNQCIYRLKTLGLKRNLSYIKDHLNESNQNPDDLILSHFNKMKLAHHKKSNEFSFSELKNINIESKDFIEEKYLELENSIHSNYNENQFHQSNRILNVDMNKFINEEFTENESLQQNLPINFNNQKTEDIFKDNGNEIKFLEDLYLSSSKSSETLLHLNNDVIEMDEDLFRLGEIGNNTGFNRDADLISNYAIFNPNQDSNKAIRFKGSELNCSNITDSSSFVIKNNEKQSLNLKKQKEDDYLNMNFSDDDRCLKLDNKIYDDSDTYTSSNINVSNTNHENDLNHIDEILESQLFKMMNYSQQAEVLNRIIQDLYYLKLNEGSSSELYLRGMKVQTKIVNLLIKITEEQIKLKSNKCSINILN